MTAPDARIILTTVVVSTATMESAWTAWTITLADVTQVKCPINPLDLLMKHISVSHGDLPIFGQYHTVLIH